MKILYDHQAFTRQYFGGISKCFCELISNLPKEINFEISIKESNNVHLINSHLCTDFTPVSFDNISYLNRFTFKGRGKLWNFLMKVPFFRPTEKINEENSTRIIEKQDFDVFHPTFYNPYFLKHLKGKPFVLTVHDMISEIFRNLKMDEDVRNKFVTVKNAAALIAVSENTKRDLCEILHVPEKKVHVIYHGGPKLLEKKHDPIIKEKYLLYVGDRNAYKQFGFLLKEFALFCRYNNDVKLVCTGKSFSHDEIVQMEKLNVRDQIVHFSASDQEMPHLYSNAIAFIYPSEYEGFGMPILEAYASGCPVILNKKSCFPEIAGDAAVYFDTTVDGSIKKTVEEIISYNDEQRFCLINKGYNRLSRYSWSESAKQLVQVYESVL